MSRHGFLLPTILLCAGAAGLLTLAIIAAAAQRSQHARMHQARVQGREWCLGIHGLRTPTSIDLGAWKLSMDTRHVARIQAPRGTYAISATGQERPMIDDLMRVIALTAGERRPLPPALRELGTPLANRVAERLEAGEALPLALGGSLDPQLADLLAGPRPDTASAALPVGEWLRMQRADRLAAIARLTHPACGLLVIAAATFFVAWAGPTPYAGWLAAAGVLATGAVLITLSVWPAAVARVPAFTHQLPWLAASGMHARLASTYERAALVARWRLCEKQLEPFIGDDLTRLAPVLADPQAEDHCRRLAEYHRDAERRARQRLWWLIMALGYVAGGCLFLAAAVPLVDSWVTILCGIGQVNYK